MPRYDRRGFIHHAAFTAGACFAGNAFAQSTAEKVVVPDKERLIELVERGERPKQSAEVTVVNPRNRVPVGIIIDDSTCLVNLNRFAVPQFAQVLGRLSHHAKLPWREWPVEIPDSFLRKFGEWAVENGVRGKFSIVPYPACVGRLDRMLPGWTAKELEDSLELVRSVIMPNWDITPEMITHTRVIDTKTGHPYPEFTSKYMENWDWPTGRSVDEIADYLAYALRILKNGGLNCEGITTPGGFGKKARPNLAQATLQSVRDVFSAEIPHYFTDLTSSGNNSVSPIVQYASGLEGPDPRCVVYVPGCTGDWTGGWDNTGPDGGADNFITADGKSGRMVDVIARGEPAMMFGHWTGLHFNGQELGFKIYQEVVKRLHARFDNLHWMKMSELSRYWAAKELTRIERVADAIHFHAPFACTEFTVRWKGVATNAAAIMTAGERKELQQVKALLKLVPGTWCQDGEHIIACFALPKGASKLQTA